MATNSFSVSTHLISICYWYSAQNTLNEATSSYCGAHLVESYCKESNISDTNCKINQVNQQVNHVSNTRQLVNQVNQQVKQVTKQENHVTTVNQSMNQETDK